MPIGRSSFDARQPGNAPVRFGVNNANLLTLPFALIATATRMHPKAGLAAAKDRIKYVLRGLATPKLTRDWFQLLQKPEMAVIFRGNPRLLSKLQRPYLYCGLGPKQRLEALQEHYRFVTEHFSQAALQKIYSRAGLRLALVSVKDRGKFTLRFLFRKLFEKEGELTVVLVSETTQYPLMAMSFTIVSGTASKQIFIGGLQAIRLLYQRDLIVPMTRSMHGLRPKGLLLYAVQRLATLWGIGTIHAVSNERSVYRDFRLKKKRVLVNYDDFWLESGGQLGADGLFTLPSTFVPRPVATIKPNKRSLYKQRYALLDNIGAQIDRSVKAISI